MNEKTLFIGGPKDGKRELVPNAHGLHLECAVFPPRWQVLRIDEPLCTVETHHYVITQLNDGGGNELRVAVHSSVKNVLQQLIKGYHRYRKPRYK